MSLLNEGDETNYELFWAVPVGRGLLPLPMAL